MHGDDESIDGGWEREDLEVYYGVLTNWKINPGAGIVRINNSYS